MRVEYYKGYAIMYHGVKEKFYLYTGPYTKSVTHYYADVKDAKQAIDQFYAMLAKIR